MNKMYEVNIMRTQTINKMYKYNVEAKNKDDANYIAFNNHINNCMEAPGGYTEDRIFESYLINKKGNK